MLEVSENVQIPEHELNFSFARSGGPGGQNVNKVNSKATLRWSVTGTQSLPHGVRMRFMERYGGRLNDEGELVLTSQRFRDQASNVEDCREKLKEIITTVLVPPVKRRETKPTYASKVKRIQSKTREGQKKQNRRAPRDYD
jgi:ribosome-associated protein